MSIFKNYHKYSKIFNIILDINVKNGGIIKPGKLIKYIWSNKQFQFRDNFSAFNIISHDFRVKIDLNELLIPNKRSKGYQFTYTKKPLHFNEIKVNFISYFMNEKGVLFCVIGASSIQGLNIDKICGYATIKVKEFDFYFETYFENGIHEGCVSSVICSMDQIKKKNIDKMEMEVNIYISKYIERYNKEYGMEMNYVIVNDCNFGPKNIIPQKGKGNVFCLIEEQVLLNDSTIEYIDV